jgi:hypothetical protein
MTTKTEAATRRDDADRHDGRHLRTVPASVTIVVAGIVGLIGFGLGWLLFTDGDGDQVTRHDRSAAVIEEVVAILDDPVAFGSEEEIAAALAHHAAPGALMEDAVLGSVPYETGFFETLFGGTVDAEIDVHHFTVSEDGSQSVILWTWHGTNTVGNPFELIGISIDTHDDEGRITHELVTYPYSDDHVREAFLGEGT